ncbi:MAG TPA: hypothetical protein VFP84_14885 [Kofleriaceae bacterium]|nr:hypothetical protein [Kofleriaceae bacterium]
MRLSMCIALELVAAASVAAGAWLVVTRAPELAHTYIKAHEAEAATATGLPRRGAALVPLERSQLAVVPPPVDTVFGVPDADLLAPIASAPLVKAKLNHGGTSLSMRLDFASGARAAFKPQQVHPQSDPRREIAAYRIDRMLGIGHVAPCKSAGFEVDALVAAFEPGKRGQAAARIEDEALPRHGKLYGEVQWWIPDIKLLQLDGQNIDEPEGQAIWSDDLQVGARVPPDHAPIVAQIATVILFDLLIDNSDRWSGNNTQGSLDGRTLYFMDNTLAFSLFTLGHASNLSKLNKIQVFPRKLVGKLRQLTIESIAEAVGPDDELLGPLLTPGEIRAMIARRDHVLEYIDRLIAEFGENAVLALP